MSPESIDRLKNWFLEHKRHLPWREKTTPYRVWVSEVMLQQTQASVVIPYFEKWMRTFPTVEALAHAPIERVLKCWEGLGYYSRARALHSGAQMVCRDYKGEFPQDPKLLQKIKGIGPYTVGALMNFAFQRSFPALDGNVLRVLSRFWGESQEIDRGAVQKELREKLAKMLPEKEGWIVSEALIELGALVCKKKANCTSCPLKKECYAFKYQVQQTLPKKRPRDRAISLVRSVAVVENKGRYLVIQEKKQKVMQGLYQFPFLESAEMCAERLEREFSLFLSLSLSYRRPLQKQRHTFTKYRVELIPHYMVTTQESKEGLWYSIDELKQLPFSSGHKRILETI